MLQLLEKIRVGVVYAMSWANRTDPDDEGARFFGVVKCDWHCEDLGQPWNLYVTKQYMMCQGFVYERGAFNPTKWRGLIDFHEVFMIERFPRREFDAIR